MKIEALIRSIRQAGFMLDVDGENLAVVPFSKLSDPQIKLLKQHKTEIIAELQTATIKYWRFRHNGIEVDFASGATVTEAYDLLRCEPDDELRPIIEYGGQGDHTTLNEDQLNRLLDDAVAGLNLSRDGLLELLSDDDVADIRRGDIGLETVRGYAELWAKREPADIDHDIRADIKQVTCGKCQNFQPDKIGDGTGIGSCAIGAWKPGRGPCLYPERETIL